MTKQSPRRTVSLAALIAVFGALALAAPAGAAVTSSRIEQPAGLTYAIFNWDLGEHLLTISGTATSTAPATDEVDIDCFFGETGVIPVAAGLPLEPDGHFSVEAEIVTGEPCRLAAVPAGTEPREDPGFSGPAVSLGIGRSWKVTSGPDVGTPYDFVVEPVQLGGANELFGMSSCGVISRLFAPGHDGSAETFSCVDYYYPEVTVDGEGRSELRIDGSNAYGAQAADNVNADAPGLPGVSFDYSQDAANGDTIVHEHETLVRCPETTYPPTPASCPEFISTGVRDDRTYETTEGGRSVIVTDRFVSTDGEPHQLDLLPENDQRFRLGSVDRGGEIAYRFPGESSFSLRSEGETVPFADGTPGIVYVEVEGVPDGNLETGRAAIVFDRPSSPARFTGGEPNYSGLVFHQALDIQAGGVATSRFAYVQGFTGAEVERLALQAKASFGPAPPGPLPVKPPSGGGSRGGGPPAPVAKPSNLFRFRHSRLDRRQGTARLTVFAPGAGTFVLSGNKVRRVTRTVVRAGSVLLTVKPKPEVAKRLRHGARMAVRFSVEFVPTGGTPLTRSTRLVLAAKAKR
jgi:hypothetical protein